MILVLTKHQLYRLCIESLKEKKIRSHNWYTSYQFLYTNRICSISTYPWRTEENMHVLTEYNTLRLFFSCKKCKSALCCLNCEQHNVTISHNWFHKLQFIKAVLGRPHPAPVEPLLINFHKSRRNRFTLNTHGPAN